MSVDRCTVLVAYAAAAPASIEVLRIGTVARRSCHCCLFAAFRAAALSLMASRLVQELQLTKRNFIRNGSLAAIDFHNSVLGKTTDFKTFAQLVE